MDFVKIFESIMLLCFGAAWPFSIYRLLKTKNSAGKSVPFLSVILTGYISGIFYKIYGRCDAIIVLYILNAIMVSTDLLLTVRYRKPAQ
jgi:hypothetical protein